MSIANGTYTRTDFAPSKDGVYPRFYMHEEVNPGKSMAAGREIWDTYEMVEMLMPGNLLTRPTAKVTDEYRQRWPEAYAAFKRQEEYVPDGFPIEQWPLLNKGMVRELKFLGLHTVEMLAEMSDQTVQRLGMGGRSIVEAAKAWLKDATDLAPMRKISEDNAALTNRVQTQQLQLDEQSRQLELLNARFLAMASAPHPISSAFPFEADPHARGGAAAAPQVEGGALAGFATRPVARKRGAAAPAPAAPTSSPKKVKAA